MSHEIVRVWDLPTRLFHWGLLVCVAGLFATAYLPGASIEVHARFGYGVLLLLAFRLAWGVVGGHWSRFVNIVPSPGAVLAYLRGQPLPGRLGHNPLGGLAVLAMLAALLAQVGTGLAATSWHKGLGQWILVALIALHVGAIAYYALVQRNNLVRPMLHGDKPVSGPAVSSRDDLTTRLLALALLATCGLGVYLLVTAAG